LFGLGLAGVGLALVTADGRAASIARAWFLVGGLIVAGAAIGRRLRTAGWELEERLESAGMVAVGALVALVAYLAVIKEFKDADGKTNPGDDWTSAEFFLIGVIVIALAGAALIALPTLIRKVLIAALVLFHFGGIFDAAFNVEPLGRGEPPWLTQQLWTRVYRFYLGYVYMTNAYHFYSPDPGPSTLAWFRIQYDDDSYRWVQLPNKKDSVLPLQYTRLMVVADSTKLSQPGSVLPPRIFLESLRERKVAGRFFVPEPTRDGQKFRGEPIPITEQQFLYGDNVPIAPELYREPTLYCKMLIASYVRYVAKNYPNENDPALGIKNIKVYSITHSLIPARDMAKGHSPFEEIYLYPYYMGTFDAQGELLIPQQQYNQFGEPVLAKSDGFLYWMVPIFAVPKHPGGDFRVPEEDREYTVRNYLRLHAGDIRSFDDDPKAEPKKEEGHP
jgi:hypothetical protein